MNIQAHAKINLTLNVVGKRADGYHELEMIMVPITLHDDITIEIGDKDRFTCSGQSLVLDDTNTIVKAVKLMRNTYGLQEQFHVHVEKHIPMQAGLAGGSADAAGVMKGINQLLQLGIPIEDLSLLGKQIGADVPFCVYEKPAVVTGIGEHIRPITIAMPFEILLVKPMAGVPTGKAFSMIDFATCEHPDYRQVENDVQQRDYKAFCKALGNTLEQSAFQIVPEIYQLKKRLASMGFDAVLMSGSGSTVFALTKNVEVLRKAKQQLEQEDLFVVNTHIYNS